MNPRDKILDGDLQTLGLQATLKMLALGGKTGHLHVTTMPDRNDTLHQSEELWIYLKHGSILTLGATPSSQVDLLEMFRRLRRIHPYDADEMREHSGNQPIAILTMLVERGIMSPTEQQQRLEFAVIQEVARALRWEHGTFEFLTNKRIADSALQPMSVDHILLEAIRLVDEWKAVQTTPELTRTSIPRWVNEFNGNIGSLTLQPEDVGILALSTGNYQLASIANALLISEPRVAQRIEKLIDLQLVELVDNTLERQREHSLMNVLTVSQGQLQSDPRQSPEQRLLVLTDVMGTCVNKLLSHHSIYARALRGRNVPRAEALRTLDMGFIPVLRRVQQEYPISETVALYDGQITYTDLLHLPKMVKGEELEDLIWEVVLAFQRLMNETYRLIVQDEFGASRTSRRFMELWETFAQEIAGEIERHYARRLASPRRGGA